MKKSLLLICRLQTLRNLWYMNLTLDKVIFPKLGALQDYKINCVNAPKTIK